MRSYFRTLCRATAVALVVSAFCLMIGQQAYSQQSPTPKLSETTSEESPSQVQARTIQMRMAEFLGNAQAFSVNLRGGYDAVQRSGQKIEFGELRKITVSRPDRLRVESERSDGTKTLTIFTGKEIAVVESSSILIRSSQYG